MPVIDSTEQEDFEARRKLAHSKVSRDAIVTALKAAGLRGGPFSYEATANQIIHHLPVHDGCQFTDVQGRLLPATEPTS
jgi:hypothetical protein